MATTMTAPGSGSLRVHAQRVGTFLSNMVMPNIGAIIAWGLITAFFIPVGWTPNEKIAKKELLEAVDLYYNLATSLVNQ